ncbi:MAG: leucine-rich repeat domain-containing protein, partial [Ferruginibacter sp.]
MIVKSILLIVILAGCTFIFKSFAKNSVVPETPIDKAWWDGLSAEWKSILLINQNFRDQRVDVYTLQNGYINRMNSENEDDYSEMNTSLHDLFGMKKFSLGYPYFYARALRLKFVVKNDDINLATLGDLDRIYMVNGPGDLTPLKKFPNLRVLILTDCGIDNDVPIARQLLDLEPLRYLKKLQVLHCSSNALRSIEPIRELVELQELRLDNTSVTDLSPLKKLV